MLIRQIADDKLAQYAYLIGCQRTGEAIIIDPERDVDRYVDAAAREGLRLVAVAETHIHADFLSGARELAQLLPGLRVYLSGEGGEAWRHRWPEEDGVPVIRLRDGDRFMIGNIELRAWHTPGHTPEHLVYVITDHGGGAAIPMGIVSGDFLFVNDLGRPDLLESALGVRGVMQDAARQLYESARQLETFDDYLQIWPGHGAGSACGKALGAVPVTTLGYERRTSPALLKVAGPQDEFVRHILADQPEPPLYFADMKRLNRDGAPVLGRLPAPPRLSADEIQPVVSRRDVQIVDTRIDRRAFLDAHLPASLYVPFNRAFTTTAGSVLDLRSPIVLLIDDTAIDDAVRDLVRIGGDRIVGWAPPTAIDDLRRRGVVPAHIDSIDFAEFERRRSSGPIEVLDVRSAAEHAVRHVPGSQAIAHTRLRDRLDEVSDGGPVYVHCAAGARAAAAAALLARYGRRVVHVDGPFTSWTPDAEGAVAGAPA
jgi:hydroxyacylglutathione hydrolase